MSARNVTHSQQTRILAAVLLLVAGGPAVAAAASGTAGGGESPQGVVTIATGADMSVDGFLSVSPDDFGQWASVTFSGGGDIFNPAGAAPPLEATFTSALFLFVPTRSQRIVLTENPDHRALADDFSLTIAVTSPSVASDTNGDSVNDTLVSSFSATGTDTALGFDLTQAVFSGLPGVAAIRQEYTVTNNAALPIDLVLARIYDGDLLWDGDFINDQVGTDWNAVGGDRFVFMQEAADPEATSITLSDPTASAYFGGKNTVLPAGGPPPYGFGTSSDVFDAFGIPTTWINHVANVGYDTDGVSGTTPGEDGFIGLGGSGTLGPGESTTITTHHTYGQEMIPVELITFRVDND